MKLHSTHTKMPQPPSNSTDAVSVDCPAEAVGEWTFAAELGNLQCELQAYAAVSGDPSYAADIVQEANMVILEKRDNIQHEEEGDFRAWTFRITYFKALAHRRDQDTLIFMDRPYSHAVRKP